MSIKKILFSQDKPANFEKTPYADLKKNYKVDVDFFKFFSIEGVPLAEFRKQRINILDYSAIIMTSKNAIDQFFRIVEECKIKLPITTKYFCVPRGGHNTNSDPSAPGWVLLCENGS